MNASSHVPAAPSNAYAGDVTPAQAFEALQTQAAAQLVDVRTIPEWQAGTPDLQASGKKTHLIALKNAPDFEYNSSFLAEITAVIPDKETPIYLLCKVGGRSADAAAQLTQLGYQYCYNIIGGFEGLEQAPGWKASQLPWGK